MAAALVGCGIDGFGVVGIDGDIGKAGVLADVQNFLPSFAAIGGAVEPAISSRRPEGSLGRNKNCIAIFRTDGNAPDMLGMLQSHIGPALASVFRLVNAITVIDAALGIVLAGAHPHNRWITRIELDVADRERSF